ncbi:MAG TPA: hypothetical protein VFQ68_32055 [Streptosporangiaceae bacterium]|nr:hypothetical protein [Streptosporangiaceae bacterium]
MSGYQPYPSTGKPVEPDRGEAPPSVRQAVKLMYAGAAVSTVSLIVSLISIGSIKSSIRTQFPKYTTTQVNNAFTSFLVVVIVSAVLGIGLWLWMARANGQGRNWARIMSSVLFAVYTLELLLGLRGPTTALSLLFPVLTWLVGLGAIVLLWRKESSDFFKPRQFV